MKIPAELTAGVSATWLDDPLTDNEGREISPAEGWALSYAIRGATQLTVAASTEGNQWRSSVSTTETGALVAGTYYWQAFVSKDAERLMIGAGQIKVLADLDAISDVYDGRSQAEKDLDSVRAAIRAILSGGAVSEYTIGGRSLRKYALADLIMLEEKLKRDVAQEKRAEKIRNGLGDPSSVYVRFR